MRFLAIVLCFVAFVGCTTPTATWISASNFDYQEYRDKRVAVLPVVAHPLVAPDGPLLGKLQLIVARQLNVLDIGKKLTRVSPDQARLEFPLTPERLRKFGKDNGYDAVIGINVVRADQRPFNGEWWFTGDVAFVDVANPKRRWTLAKTWVVTGDPTDWSAELQLSNALSRDFLEVRTALQRGRVSRLLRRDTVVVDVGPTLNMDIAAAPHDFIRPALASLLNRPEQPSFGTSSKVVSVDVFAIDDAGIAKLSVESGGANRDVVAVEAVKASGATADQLPIYVSKRVMVFLSPGDNLISARCTNGKGEEVTRLLKVNNARASSAPLPNVESRAVEMILIAGETGESDREVQLSPDARGRIAYFQSKSTDGVAVDNGARIVVFSGQSATRERIMKYLGALRNAGPVSDSTRVAVYVGRIAMVFGRPYMVLAHSDPIFPEVGSISLDEFVQAASAGRAHVALDVCSDDSSVVEVRDLLQKHDDWEISVVSCGEQLGALFSRVTSTATAVR
jgi:hypothetical protein